jgi:hypothetical protein
VCSELRGEGTPAKKEEPGLAWTPWIGSIGIIVGFRENYTGKYDMNFFVTIFMNF